MVARRIPYIWPPTRWATDGFAMTVDKAGPWINFLDAQAVVTALRQQLQENNQSLESAMETMGEAEKELKLLRIELSAVRAANERLRNGG